MVRSPVKRIDKSMAELLEEVKKAHKERSGIEISTTQASKKIVDDLKNGGYLNKLKDRRGDDFRIF